MRRDQEIPREGRTRARDTGDELRVAGRARVRGRRGGPGRVRLGGVDGRDEACLRKRHAVPGKASAHLQAFRPIPRPAGRALDGPGRRARGRLGAQALRRLRSGDRPARRQREPDPARAHRRQQHQPRHRAPTADPRPAGAQPQPSGARRGARISLHARRGREGRRRGAGAQGGAHDAAARLPPTSRKGNRARRRLLVGGGHQKPSHGGQGARPKRGRVHGRARSARS